VKALDAVGTALQKEIQEALARNLCEDAATIGVVVDGEVATLTGHAPTLAQKWSAEEAARTTGAAAVVNEIQVQLTPEDNVPDERLARTVLDVLKWDARLPMDRVQVSVADGCVALTGTVDWPFQMASATGAVAQVRGVRGLSNQLEPKPRVSPEGVQAQIRAAFERGAAIDASHVVVAVKGGEVTLTGYVRTWAEREDAEAAARATPGVVEVENHLRIANW
jgi:osmotically-inducible protein OsmY